MEKGQPVWLRSTASGWGWVPALVHDREEATTKGIAVLSGTLRDDPTSSCSSTFSEQDSVAVQRNNTAGCSSSSSSSPFYDEDLHRSGEVRGDGYYADIPPFEIVVTIDIESAERDELEDIKIREANRSTNRVIVGGVDDLIDLAHLHEPAILHAGGFVIDVHRVGDSQAHRCPQHSADPPAEWCDVPASNDVRTDDDENLTHSDESIICDEESMMLDAIVNEDGSVHNEKDNSMYHEKDESMYTPDGNAQRAMIQRIMPSMPSVSVPSTTAWPLPAATAWIPSTSTMGSLTWRPMRATTASTMIASTPRPAGFMPASAGSTLTPRSPPPSWSAPTARMLARKARAVSSTTGSSRGAARPSDDGAADAFPEAWREQQEDGDNQHHLLQVQANMAILPGTCSIKEEKKRFTKQLASSQVAPAPPCISRGEGSLTEKAGPGESLQGKKVLR